MDSANKIIIQNYSETIKKSISHYAALVDWVPQGIFDKLAPHINPNHIDDVTLLSNKRLKNIVDWDSIERRKLIRLIIRDKYVIELLDMNKHDFLITDLIPIFRAHPDLIEYFEIDYENLSAVDAIHMLEINQVFIEKIDLSKFEYTKHQLLKIIDLFSDNDRIINQLNFEVLDSFVLKKLILSEGRRYLDKLDLLKLKTLDWLDILQKYPDMEELCDLNEFKKGDYFDLVKLVKILPHLDYLIEENKDNISAYGWETLLIFSPEKYSVFCNFEMLSQKNWDSIVLKQPSMANLMRRYVL